MKVRQARVGDAPGLGAGQRQQGLHALRRLRQAFAVGKQGELRHAPGRLHAVRGHGKIVQRGGLSFHVDPAEVGQAFGVRAEQQALALHRGKVLAVDPDQIHRALGGHAARGLLGTHAFDHVGRVGDLHVLQLHAKRSLHLLRHPLDVGVGLFAAGPRVPEHGLATGGLLDGRPVRLRPGRLQGCTGGGSGGQQPLAAGQVGGGGGLRQSGFSGINDCRCAA
ncbi:hypothetical protein D9M68_751470 [compost metagenome]